MVILNSLHNKIMEDMVFYFDDLTNNFVILRVTWTKTMDNSAEKILVQCLSGHIQSENCELCV